MARKRIEARDQGSSGPSQTEAGAGREIIRNNPGVTFTTYKERMVSKGFDNPIKQTFYRLAKEWRSERGYGPMPRGGDPAPVNFSERPERGAQRPSHREHAMASRVSELEKRVSRMEIAVRSAGEELLK